MQLAFGQHMGGDVLGLRPSAASSAQRGQLILHMSMMRLRAATACLRSASCTDSAPTSA
ncbi:hypothetical protein ACIU1J_03560 [Azospirillum doebereinerae]|uniref:hypothetical protein n=1 Tax=Azospirillum doebereinerae TaxID=92933 RepID=UPI001EE5D215|nr:hypothetical protein [Azospirillum doebereinerae]MCG5241197.1 hypothetical protein [Azospirillum doebereinerae]